MLFRILSGNPKLYEELFYGYGWFYIKTPSMTFLGFWTVIQLWSNKRLDKNGVLLSAHEFVNPFNAWSFFY